MASMVFSHLLLFLSNGVSVSLSSDGRPIEYRGNGGKLGSIAFHTKTRIETFFSVFQNPSGNKLMPSHLEQVLQELTERPEVPHSAGGTHCVGCSASSPGRFGLKTAVFLPDTCF